MFGACLKSATSFLDFIYSHLPRGAGCGKLNWQLNGSGLFDVRSYYAVLRGTPVISFPWKSIWCVKAP
jgi:hypothetical protein